MSKFTYTVTHTIEPQSELLCGECEYLYESEYDGHKCYDCDLFEEDLLYIDKEHIERCGLCMDAEDRYNKENSNE